MLKTFKQLRKAAGLTQVQLAERCGISVQYVTLIERGGYVPSDEIKHKIAKALGEFPSDFLEHAGAYRADEIWSEPNPIIAEPLRVFVLELEKRAREKSYPDQIAQIEGWRKRGTWLLFQEMIFAAKRLGLKLPRV